MANRQTAKKIMKSEEIECNFDLPQLPSLLTKPLGLEGWVSYEPVLLAALASEDPLLLIGPHGSAKSFLLERLAQTLELEYRFYNASLINYDDLVGIPIPDEERKKLQYISTPSAIWDAEVVFFDEINRTRPELQNKLFPIVHERRIQGIKLEKLRYRWSAMNPAPSADGEDDSIDIYLGAEPLDPSLADRFAFVMEVPGWQNLTTDEKRSIFRDQFKGRHDFPVPFPTLVAVTKQHLEAYENSPPAVLEDYLLSLMAKLEDNRINLSTRRATMLYQNILSVHAARTTLYLSTLPELPPQVIDWNTSALLALQNSLPHTAQGRRPDPAVLLAAHRHAWAVSKLDVANPWRSLFQIKDPTERCITAISMGNQIDDEYMSQLILEGISALPEGADRTTAAFVIYLAVHKTRNLRATTFETLAQEIRHILKPGEYSHEPDDCPRERYRQVKDACAKLSKGDNDNPVSVRNRYAVNLLQGLLPDGYQQKAPGKILNQFFNLWDRLIPTPIVESEKEVAR